jgi:hypothetical protein
VRVIPSNTTPGQLTVTWDAVPKPSRGTSVRQYVVSGSGGAGQQRTATTSASFSGLEPGTTYTFSVHAENGAQVSSSSDWAESGSVGRAAVGVPGAFNSSARASGRDVAIIWDRPTAAGGDAIKFTLYRQSTIGALNGCSADGTVLPLGATDSTSFADTAPSDAQFKYTVIASNGFFCSSSSSLSEAITPPEPTTAEVSLAQYGNDGKFKPRVDSLASRGADAFQYQVDGGNWNDVSRGDFVAVDRADGRAVSLVFRGCKTGSTRSECTTSEALSVTPVDTRATVNTCVPDEPLTIDKASNSGQGLSSVDVQYRLQSAPATWVDKAEEEDVPSNAIAVQVRGHAGGQTDSTFRPTGILPGTGLTCG